MIGQSKCNRHREFHAAQDGEEKLGRLSRLKQVAVGNTAQPVTPRGDSSLLEEGEEGSETLVVQRPRHDPGPVTPITPLDALIGRDAISMVAPHCRWQLLLPVLSVGWVRSG